MNWGAVIGGAIGAIFAFNVGYWLGRQHGYVHGYHIARVDQVIKRVK